MWIVWKLFQLIFFCRGCCFCLKSVSIHVPPIIKSGDSITLKCDYDLENVPLYTIKWYKDDVEFYKYVPKESPPYRAYPVPYIDVDFSRSGPKSVTLRNTRKEVSGEYKCEVSAEAPLFHTEIKSAPLIVAQLPKDNPTITTELRENILTADCFSSPSNPPANLTWFINDQQITDLSRGIVLYRTVITPDHSGLYSIRTRLRLTLDADQFYLNQLILKCDGRISNVWNSFEVKMVKETIAFIPPVLGSTSSQNHQNDNNNGSEKKFQKGIIILIWSLIVIR